MVVCAKYAEDVRVQDKRRGGFKVCGWMTLYQCKSYINTDHFEAMPDHNDISEDLIAGGISKTS